MDLRALSVPPDSSGTVQRVETDRMESEGERGTKEKSAFQDWMGTRELPAVPERREFRAIRGAEGQMEAR